MSCFYAVAACLSRLRRGVFVVALMAPIALLAQMQVTSGVFSPKDLIENVFLSSGVQVLQVDYKGSPSAIGYFSSAETNVGIPSGIIMSTGLAATAATPNNSGSTSGPTIGVLGDPDLEALVAPLEIRDLSLFEIRFIPYSDTLEFRYAFASEEYQEYVCTNFNDVFGFFISGPGFSGPFSNGGENIALVPGTSTYVAINTVNNGNPNMSPAACPPQNPQFFKLVPQNAQPTYDGITDVFLARAIVVPCDTYTIRLAIADASDQVFDSGVFLEAKSFGTPAIDFSLSTAASNETIAEGCANGIGTFSIRYKTPVPLEVPLQFVGTAEYGVDYIMTPSVILIPAGADKIDVTFEVFQDDILEGPETIGLVFQRNPCELDTLWINITDDTLPRPNLGPDLLQCLDVSLLVDGTLPVVLPEPKTFINPNAYFLPSPPNITSPLTPVFSPIQVSGVFPKTLGPGMIESVCINILHPWIDDVDVYLVAPSGRFMALTTDNGRDGDHYIETCFSPKATQRIDYGDPFGAPKAAAPFTGLFIPEGKWSDLWDAPENPVNGEWKLLVIDDAPLPDGELQNWRITFLPEYSIDYLWSPGAEVSCDTCALTNIIADGPKTIILEVRDSYGCSRTDTLVLDVHPDLQDPLADCTDIGYKELLITWDNQGIGEQYEISINGGPWQSPNAAGGFGFLAEGLGLADSLTFVVRALGPCGETEVTLGCRTLDCVPAEVVVDQVTMPRCAGSLDGSFQVSVLQGTAPYTLELNGSIVAPGTFTGLGSGTYQLKTLDTLGCSDELMVVLIDPAALLLQNVVFDTVRCAGAANGALAPVVTGGTGIYAFQWADGATDSLRTGLAGGNYAVTITDAQGCTISQELTLFEFSPVLAQTETQDPTCSTTSNGEVRVNVQGGAGNYTYNWSIPGVQTAVAGGLSPGTYFVTVTDANGCTVALSASLSSPLDLVIATNSLPTSCFGSADGRVEITVTGGTPPYTFIWSDGGPGLATRNDLPAGSYTITITDQDACDAVVNVSVAQPAAIEVVATVTSPACNGQSNGSIAVTASGGAGGYVFQWSTGATGATIANLPAGTYFVTTTDNNGCTAVDTLVLINPPAIVTSASAKAVSCFGGSNGTVTVSASGGNGGFTFLWDNPSASTQASVNDLPAGVYRVTVTDSKGCTKVDSTTVTSPPVFSSAVFSTPVSCFGQSNGTGTVTPLGGQPPYTYLWNDPAAQTTAVAANLQAGSWQVTITDNNGCTTVNAVDITSPPELLLNVNPTQITCFGANDGKAQAQASGGTAPYSYDWSSGSKQALAQNLAPGTYTVTVTDNRGCTALSNVTITQAPEILITGTASAVRCSGDKDGFIDITVTGGAPPYSYAWNHGATVEDPDGLGPGIYVVSVTDAFNCTRTFNITITSPPGMLSDIAKNDIACFGDSTGRAEIIITGGSPTYSYAWSNGGSTPELQGLLPGVYVVTVTDQNDCTVSRSITINQPEAPLSATMIGDTLDCFGDRNGRIVFSASGGTPAYRYSLDGTQYNGSSIQIGLAAGTYQGYIRDKEGCEYAVGEATIFQPDQILVELGPDITIELGRDTQLMAMVSQGIPPYTYSWFLQDSAFLSCLTCPNPIVRGLEYTRTFRVQVTDANGCTNEAVITVNVQKTRIVLVPTAFTPNSDGQNDRLGVVGRPGTIIRNFQVFDRWGERVFYADNFLIEEGLLPENSWDGVFRGSPMNSGVFVWTLEAFFIDGEQTQLKGQSMLIR